MKTIIFIKMKIKHHSIFNNLRDKSINWNALRDDQMEPHYFLPKEKKDYVKLCNLNKNKILIDSIVKILDNKKIKNIFSLGSGRACLEFHLSKHKEVTISDLSKSILNLKKYNLFKNVYHLDIFDALEKIELHQIVLLGRIDTEFDDKQLKLLFNKMHIKQNPILFIPAQKLTIFSLLMEIYIRIKAIFLFKKLVFCGYSRTYKHFEKIWSDYYKFYPFKGFYYLEPK